jgi:hypothetical protein
MLKKLTRITKMRVLLDSRIKPIGILNPEITTKSRSKKSAST